MKYAIKYYVIGFFVLTTIIGISVSLITGIDISDDNNSYLFTIICMIPSFMIVNYVYNAIETNKRDIRSSLRILSQIGMCSISMSLCAWPIILLTAITDTDITLYDMGASLISVTLIALVPVKILSKLNDSDFGTELRNIFNKEIDKNTSKRVIQKVTTPKRELVRPVAAQGDRKKFCMYSRMNGREREIYKSRKQISDERLISFFRALQNSNPEPSPFGRGHVLAVMLINKALDEGWLLDKIFYTGNRYGYSLSVSQITDNTFNISFGCQVDPLAGDGGGWQASFSGNQINSISDGFQWIS